MFSNLNSNIYNNRDIYLKIGTGFFLLIILMANIKRAMNGELFAYDYGIFEQGVFELAKGDINPFVSVRDIKLWNDHFEPILFTAVPWGWLWDFSTSAMVAYEWLWFAAAIVVTFYLVRDKDFKIKLISVVFVLFAKGILSGIHFAIHPGVWSAPIWILLCFHLARENWEKVLLYSLIIMTFRESYIFGVMTLTSMMIVLGKERGGSTLLFVFALAYGIFVFILRKHIVGPVEEYGSIFVHNLLSRPISFLGEAFLSFDWKIFLKLYYPFFIPVPVMIYHLWQEKKDILLLFVALVGPHYFLHFLAGKFNYQYGVAAVAPILGLMYGTNIFEYFKDNKKLYGLILLLPILSGMGYHTKFMKLIFKKYPNGSRLFSEVFNEKGPIRKALLAIPKDKKIIGPSRATPALYRPGMTNLYTVEAGLKRDKIFDYLFYWKGQGYAFEGKDVIKGTIMDRFCRKYVEKVIYDSKVFYLAKGKFDQDCYDKNYP